MTDQHRDPEPTPSQVQQSRLVEESLREAIDLLRQNVPPECLDTGLGMVVARYAIDSKGPDAAEQWLRGLADLVHGICGEARRTH
jgi:hypothetical protein